MKSLLLCLVLAGLGPMARVAEPPATPAPIPPATAPRFEFIDVFIDSGIHPLAAWQVEVKAAAGSASIVGIEGGNGVYAEPPFYDEAAMRHDRVIIAGFSTLPAAELPSGLARVARVHVMITVEATEFAVTLSAAAQPDGTRTPATATLTRGRAPGADK